jgi:hypothetical protein
MKHDVALAKKLRALQRRVVPLKVLAAFLKKHPAVAKRTVLWQFGDITGLQFHYKAFIRPVRVTDEVTLRLERYIEDWSDYDEKTRIVCADISRLSRKELDKVLRKLKINLRNAEAEDEEEGSD